MPQEVDALDPDFLEELLARLAAEADHEALQKKRQARKVRLAEQARKMRAQMGAGWVVEDAEVE